MPRPLKKSLLLWTRTLHVYASMFALLAIFFFAITGFLLNHPTWFNLERSQIETRDALVPEDVATGEDKLALVEYLREHEQARGVVKSYSRTDERTVVNFTGPGRSMEFTVNQPTGDTAVRVETRNALAKLGDLHRGHYTGNAWPLAIDATAWFLIVVSASGLALWLSLAKRRTIGWACVALGVVAAAIALMLLP